MNRKPLKVFLIDFLFEQDLKNNNIDLYYLTCEYFFILTCIETFISSGYNCIYCVDDYYPDSCINCPCRYIYLNINNLNNLCLIY